MIMNPRSVILKYQNHMADGNEDWKLKTDMINFVNCPPL
jgi:hypothetical protein